MHVLIMEDDTFFQKFYSSKLTESGFQVTVASDGEEGLAKLAQSRPDLILLDIIMPKKDGFDVLKAISVDHSLRTIPILVFSTLGQEQDIQKAKALGAYDYVNKSLLDYNVLLTKVNQVVSMLKKS